MNPKLFGWHVDGRSIVDADNNRVALVAAGVDLASTRLIAAAPELFAALEMLLHATDLRDSNEVAWEFATAAIAKAQGES